MVTRKAAISTVKDFLKDCLNAGLKIDKAILFGSFVKEKQKKYSDIDLALISEDFGKNFLKNNKLTSKINIKYPDIEVHHFNREYYYNFSDPFIDEIKQTGFEIEISK